MNIKDPEFLNRLYETFRIEAEEHISTTVSCLLELERFPDMEIEAELIEKMFREFHSLKGASRSINFSRVEKLCGHIEDIFSKIKKQQLFISPTIIDAIFNATDHLSELIKFKFDAVPVALIDQNKLLLERFELLTSSFEIKKVSNPEYDITDFTDKEIEVKSFIETESIFNNMQTIEKKTEKETIRIPIKKLNTVLHQAEEFIVANHLRHQHEQEIKQLHKELDILKKEIIKNNTGNNHTEDSTHQIIENLEFIERNAALLSESIQKTNLSVKKLVDEHIEAVKDILMFPFSSITEGFEKMVRDLAKKQSKEVRLIIKGADVNIDKRILEELKDPIMHILRNSVDHGIKSKDFRISQNKTGYGTISIDINTFGTGMLKINISDDGNGLDLTKIKNIAIKTGLIKESELENISDIDVAPLIFHSGISSSDYVTDISGRGLGMAIVKEKVENLGGHVTVNWKPMEGTSFEITVPLSISTFKGIMIESESQKFILPLSSVVKVLRLNDDSINKVENRDTITFNQMTLRLIPLKNLLNLRSTNQIPDQKTSKDSDFHHVLILNSGRQYIALLVDHIMGEIPVLVKNLGKLLKRVRHISGVTIIGNGQIIPILNSNELTESGLKSSFETIVSNTIVIEEKNKELRVLIAEDSITSRVLLKNILQSEGYIVTTAVDGIDALSKAKTNEFDLIVSDVDMPRMNGFELTSKIRSDKKLNDIPVILITSLDSQNDRERGIDVGANAYIIKSSFDQGNLLEIIKKLI